MLRRAPTTIGLTAQDIEQYEANRQRKIREAQQQETPQSDASERSQNKDPNAELKPFPREKSKKDRIMGSGR
jgi:hypothetical protein